MLYADPRTYRPASLPPDAGGPGQASTTCWWTCPETAAQHRYHRMLVDRDGLDSWWTCSWSRRRKRRRRSGWTWTRPTTRRTASRKAVSIMATTGSTAICRCTFSASTTRCARGCGRRTGTPPTAAWESVELERIVGRIRERWPAIRIRADAGFCRDGILSWCEANAVGYVLGLARNPVLTRRFRHAMRRFRQFRYRTHSSWSRKRRVPVCNVMTRNAVIQVRIDPATRDRRRRLRLERHVNVSAWIRQLVQDALDRELGKQLGKRPGKRRAENDGTDGLGEGRRPRRRPAAPAPGMEGSLRRQSRKSSGYRNL